MTELPAQRVEDGPRWPMTRAACDRLVEDIAHLRRELSTLAGQGLEEGIVQLALLNASRRLETLTQVLDCAELVDETPFAAIGRRATLRDENGEAMSYAIVFPGDGDPAQGLISADSPLGAAILGCHPGETVDVPAPVGRWTATIVSVE